MMQRKPTPQSFDRESKGYLDEDDFNCYVITSLGFKPSKVDINIKNISYERANEFVANFERKLSREEKQIRYERDMFNSISMGKGYISMRDIEIVAEKISPHMFSNKIMDCLADDGRITFKNFRRFVRIESSYT